nr:MAG TPA: hypothetical protein [Caudoviricetes sp.]
MNDEENQDITEEVIENVDNEEVVDDENLGEFSDNADASNVDEENEKPKMLTEKEANDLAEKIAKEREARAYRKAEREKREEFKQYEELANLLKAGTGKDNLTDIKNEFANFYKNEGINIPDNKVNSEREEKILGRADAEEIIELGDDEVNRVANRIFEKPVEKRSIREKEIFEILGKHAMQEKAKKELIAKGIDEKVLDDESFKSFASKFNVSTPISEIYDVYKKMDSNRDAQELVKVKPASPGSARDVQSKKEKDFYTSEEVDSLTEADYDKNPKLIDIVRDSMLKWKK